MPALTATIALTGPAPIAYPVALTYTSFQALARLEFSGADTYEVNLAAVPAEGLRGLLVQVEALDAAGSAATAPIVVQWTSDGAQKSEEIAPGGFFALASPAPQNGVTALSIVVTAACVVRVVALG